MDVTRNLRGHIMASLPGLFRRGGSYYLRVVLPNDHPLKTSYRNGRWVQTLGACSHKEAVRLGTIKRAEVLQGNSPAPSSQPMPIQSAAPASAKPPVGMGEVYQLWAASKARSSDAQKACKRALDAFEQHCGHAPLHLITRAQGDAFRAHLLTLDLSSKTKHDRMTWVKSLLKYACRDLELIPRNPWEGLEVEYTTESRRSPWTLDQVRAFFETALFKYYELPSGWQAGGEAAYWIPLLGLYTGARVGELCQLQVHDVSMIDGGALIRINGEAEGARVKTEAGWRSVPVHSELVRLGFLDYVNAMREANSVPLWPSLKLRRGKPGGYFSVWFGQARKTCALPVPDFHSLRHTVRTAMTEAGISEAVQDRITGHEVQGSHGTRVYAHPKAVLRAAVESIRYPGLRIQRVYAPKQPPLAGQELPNT